MYSTQQYNGAKKTNYSVGLVVIWPCFSLLCKPFNRGLITLILFFFFKKMVKYFDVEKNEFIITWNKGISWFL